MEEYECKFRGTNLCPDTVKLRNKPLDKDLNDQDVNLCRTPSTDYCLTKQEINKEINTLFLLLNSRTGLVYRYEK